MRITLNQTNSLACYPPWSADAHTAPPRWPREVSLVADTGNAAALRITLAEVSALARGVCRGARMMGRIKSLPSTLNKMARKGRDLSEIHDVIGVRAILQTTSHCYRLIARIHSKFSTLREKSHDYIATPKPNGYRSFHTIVVRPNGIHVEIQVRTGWMHAICVHGSASHARYKKLQGSEDGAAADGSLWVAAAAGAAVGLDAGSAYTSDAVTGRSA